MVDTDVGSVCGGVCGRAGVHCRTIQPPHLGLAFLCSVRKSPVPAAADEHMAISASRQLSLRAAIIHET